MLNRCWMAVLTLQMLIGSSSAGHAHISGHVHNHPEEWLLFAGALFAIAAGLRYFLRKR